MKKIGNAGISSLLMVMVVASVLTLLFSSMGNMFQSLNKTTSSLKLHGTQVGVMMDMAQMLGQAYSKAKASPTCADGGNSTPYTVGGGSFILCIPNLSYCSQYGTSYCLKRPPDITVYKGRSEKDVFVVRHSIEKWNPLSLILPKASAAPPTPGLPDIDATIPPSITIAVPTCTTTSLNDRNCIRCDAPNQNAQCIKVRICTDGTTSCPTSFIEPVFAIQTNYF